MEWGSGHQRYEQIQEIGVGAYGTVYRNFANLWCLYFDGYDVIFLNVKTINVSRNKEPETVRMMARLWH